ncbi:MAG: MFS transporter [Pirellulales bacterium]|nr:MFS transporter [Pirellulales bacterium]
MTRSDSIPSDRLATPARTASAALAAILLAHFAVDAMWAFVPSTLGMLEARLGLTSQQTAWLLGLGSFFSGIAQPVCAVVSDVMRTRRLAAIGLGLAACGVGCIGLAQGMASLTMVYILGAVGVGMFHPVGAATMGHLQQHRRTSAVSLFFVVGMAGGILGAFSWPRLVSMEYGFQLLPLAFLPIVALALVLHRLIRPLGHVQTHACVDLGQASPDNNWPMVWILFASASLRFSFNMALLYLYVRWLQGLTAVVHSNWTQEQIATASAPQVGNFNAATLIGMAAGGLLAGAFVRSGHEKWPMVCVPILFAPLVVLIPNSPITGAYVLAVVVGIGFASMIPVSIALAQQCLPHQPNLASSLMMGAAWVVATLGPTCAEFCIAHYGLQTTFNLTALTLAASGLVCLPLPNAKLGT